MLQELLDTDQPAWIEADRVRAKLGGTHEAKASAAAAEDLAAAAEAAAAAAEAAVAEAAEASDLTTAVVDAFGAGRGRT